MPGLDRSVAPAEAMNYGRAAETPLVIAFGRPLP
jgi:hypothetical protein